MMRTSFFVLFLLSSFNVFASVERSQLTSAVESKEPIDDLGAFVTASRSEIITVTFFTQIVDLNDAVIEHVWLLNGKEQARVELNIGSFNWRTYSSKRLNYLLEGDWQVQVVHNQQVLHQYDFTFQTVD
ncbi:MAG: DUF2914 domain-containing protein [Alteromonadaceae bacterium]|nr:DUF2914 domain-containing protein [Alteromonadaceae bacterium]